ncbi:MAG: C10 family peptidase [Synergistales bacterium]|nr:C10 family peptidase [Synergistales bacterium]
MFLSSVGLLVLALLLGMTADPCSAAPVSEGQAKQMVRNWLAIDSTPLETELSGLIGETVGYRDKAGRPLYYIVYLEPRGFVVVAGDDLVEPIIAIVADGDRYIASEANPLGALVSRDLANRIALAREPLERLPADLQRDLQGNRNKWENLLRRETQGKEKQKLPSVDRVRVAPLVQSKWSQGTIGPRICFNYYTPNHYVCGCVATAMAQLMRYHKYPREGIGVHGSTIWVDGNEQTAHTRGGDGRGGPYDWNRMPLVPDNDTITEEERQAIGALVYDAGVAAHMKYSEDGSGAWMWDASSALAGIFNHKSSTCSFQGFKNLPAEERNRMINANLHANLPVLLSITGQRRSEAEGGWKDAAHAIIADGYGYQWREMYHHLNMGWAGHDDVWYNLPDIDLSEDYFYDTVRSVVYNIFRNASGEIISGYVHDKDGNPIPGVAVTLSGPASGDTVTNERGVYAFAGVPSGATYTLEVSKAGTHFEIPRRQVTTGTSKNDTIQTGNLWQVDFGHSHWYVTEAGYKGGRGGWENAAGSLDLQAITQGAFSGDIIYVAEGTYYPSSAAAPTVAPTATPTSAPGPTATPTPAPGPTESPTPTSAPTATPTPEPTDVDPLASGDVAPGDDNAGDIAGTPLQQSDQQGLLDALQEDGHDPGSVTGGEISATLSGGATQASFSLGSGGNALTAQIAIDASTLLFAYNGNQQAWRRLAQGEENEDIALGTAAGGRVPLQVTDQGAYDLNEEEAEITVKLGIATAAAPTSTPAPTSADGGDGGGGCAVGPSLAALLLVLLPGLWMLRR